MADAKLTPMALTKKEAKSSMPMAVSAGDSPRFDWGLQVSLNTKSLDKLKMKQLPSVGTYVTLTARCCVTSVSESQQVDGDENRSVSLQIEAMEVTPAKVMRGSVKRSAKKSSGGY